MKEINGQLQAKGRRFGIVLGRFNDLIGGRLLEGALDCIERHGGERAKVTVVRVPGAFEIPLAAARLADSGQVDAIICLGAVIRGATPHFEVVMHESAKGMAQVMLEKRLPVANGVLTTDTIEQAVERAGTKAGNKGWDAALSAIEMADLMARLG
ncbi:MAG: 6,7-dimethyl-8-ribityllumazine synthase [bacterium]|jgi:6,7-dimethyl-8-ribityllumazine synthase|nr:6,7-dimethyl-8-ribityllumazine synthase [bacterium]